MTTRREAGALRVPCHTPMPRAVRRHSICSGSLLLLLLLAVWPHPDAVAYPGPACGADPELPPLELHALPLLPPWPPTWNMSLSTAIMPCNYSGLFDTTFSSRFGITDYVRRNSVCPHPHCLVPTT